MEPPLVEFVLEDAPPILNILLTLKLIGTCFIGPLEDDLRGVEGEGELEVIVKLNGCFGVEGGLYLGEAIGK